MPNAPMRASFSHVVDLPDGRQARVAAYPDGSVRFTLDGLSYVLAEVVLIGNPGKDRAEIKLSPGRQGSAAHVNWLADRMAEEPAEGQEHCR